jgi:hypothetical protein
MPNSSDSEILSAIGHGQTEFGWNEWFGDVDTASYLTSSGKQAARRAIADLTGFFGPGWLSRAIEPGPSGPAIRGLSVYAPLLALSPARRAGRYLETIRWWASIQTLVAANVGGLSDVRRDARHDLSAHRLMHTLTQTRLSSIGLYVGAEATLEPGKSGGPGDLLLRWPGHEIFLEVVTFGPDVTSDAEDRHHHRHFLHLLSLRPDQPIYWEGDIPGLLNPGDEAAWIRSTTAAAARSAEAGEPLDIPGRDGTSLTVRPGTAPKGTSTRGPYLLSDDGSRLARSIERKGAQTRDAGIAWIWAEDFGGMHPVAPFTSMPIDAKLEALAELARPILDDRRHLAGIVWSSAQWHTQPPPDAQAQTPAGIGLQRAVPVERVRQSVILNRRVILPDQTARMAQICEAEPRWLNWALNRLGIDGGVGALLAWQPPQAAPSRLWLPR